MAVTWVEEILEGELYRKADGKCCWAGNDKAEEQAEEDESPSQPNMPA